jgi:hemin uptake protein HemP
MTIEKEVSDDPPIEPRRITADELFGDDDAIVIQHGNSDYELKITRRKRLILTKKSTGDD